MIESGKISRIITNYLITKKHGLRDNIDLPDIKRKVLHGKYEHFHFKIVITTVVVEDRKYKFLTRPYKVRPYNISEWITEPISKEDYVLLKLKYDS